MLTKENHFQYKELKGRKIFESFCNQNEGYDIVKFANNQMSRWDVAYMVGDQKYIGEIKYRNNTSTLYDDILMEVSKLKYLQNLVKDKKDVRITYINHFTDNTTFIWDITDIDISNLYIIKRKCDKNNWGSLKIDKDIFLLTEKNKIFNGKTNRLI